MRFFTSTVKRGATRSQFAATQQSGKPIIDQKPFWTAGRVLLFTAFTGSFTYLYGVNDAGKRFQLPWLNSAMPNYANKRDMEKVMRRKKCVHGFLKLNFFRRPLMSCDICSGKMLSARMMMISLCTVTLSGRLSTSINYLLQLRIQNPPRRYLRLPKSATDTVSQ